MKVLKPGLPRAGAAFRSWELPNVETEKIKSRRAFRFRKGVAEVRFAQFSTGKWFKTETPH